MIYLKAGMFITVGILVQFFMVNDYLHKEKNIRLLFLDAWLLPSMLWVLISINLYFCVHGRALKTGGKNEF